MRFLAFASLLIPVIGGAGCALVSGLDGIGVCGAGCVDGASDAGASGDAGKPDATDGGTDSGPLDSGPPVTCSAPVGACVGGLPSGWTVVSSGACPSNFTTTSFVTNVSASDGTCGCGSCSVTNNPSCSSSIPWQAGSTSNCGGTSGSANQNVCQDVTGPYLQIDPPNSFGGSCTAPTTGMPGSLQSTAVTACTPPTACQEDLCTGKLGLPICILRSGHQDNCPQGYSKRQWVGSSGSASCRCNCNVTGGCTFTGSLYTQAGCQGVPSSLMASGNCTQRGVSTLSFKGSTSVGSPSCNASGSGTASLNNEQTLCCK